MNTFTKIGLGFITGVVSTIGVLYVIANMQDSEEDKLREEIRIRALKGMQQSLDELNEDKIVHRNVHSFELNTKNGIVKLHTFMTKDSVQIIMGRPNTMDVKDNKFNNEVEETWRYKGSNKYSDEFTIEFVNGELKSVRQHKEN